MLAFVVGISVAVSVVAEFDVLPSLVINVFERGAFMSLDRELTVKAHHQQPTNIACSKKLVDQFARLRF